jgi:hypothetical protein
VTTCSPDLGNPIVRRDRNGVLLRYHPEILRPHHVKPGPQVSDSERMLLIKAEQGVRTLQTIAENMEMSDIGMDRVVAALDAIRLALRAIRTALRDPQKVDPTK